MTYLTNFMLAAAFAFSVNTISAPIALAETFVFTAIPDENEARLRERFDKVARYLTKSLGVETKYIPVKSYAAAITHFATIRYSWLGSGACPAYGRGTWYRVRKPSPRVSRIRLLKHISLPTPARA